ncbi:MAG: GNAT family N-acetyltransferase [Vicinamibacterales bacterium]
MTSATPSASIDIAEASTDDEILATRDVMRQLRPHLEPDAYLPTVRRMMQRDAYRLVALRDGGEVRAVAGFRFMEMLYCGRILYVDDLNTDAGTRSRGYGKALMRWLKTLARAEGCGQLHLDSGVQREAAHRFYFRERLTIPAYHFRVLLDLEGSDD